VLDAHSIAPRSGVLVLPDGLVQRMHPAAYVADHVGDGDAVLVMGAGKSYRIAIGVRDALEAGVLDLQHSLPGSDQ
jgi:hypothetical protein